MCQCFETVLSASQITQRIYYWVMFCCIANPFQTIQSLPNPQRVRNVASAKSHSNLAKGSRHCKHTNVHQTPPIILPVAIGFSRVAPGLRSFNRDCQGLEGFPSLWPLPTYWKGGGMNATFFVMQPRDVSSVSGVRIVN